MDNSNMQGNWGTGAYSGSSAAQKAPGIFQQFIYSFIPAKYQCLTRVTVGSMVGFVTLWMLVVTLFSFLGLLISYPSDMIDAFPDAVVRNGKFYIEEDFLYDMSGTYIYATDDVEEFSYEETKRLQASGYRQIILVGSDKLSVMQNREYQEVYFSELMSSGEFVLKDWYESTLEPIIWICIVIFGILFYVFRTLWYFLCAAIYLLIAMLAAQIFKKKLETGALFRIAVYSKVFMFAVVLVRDLIPFFHFNIPLMLRVVLTIAFMCAAIWFMPQDNRISAGMRQ